MVCAKIEILGAMTASCMTPKEIAEKAGVDVNTVYRMCKGHLVKMERFGKVCKVLGVNPKDYIDFERLKQREEKKGKK